MSSPVVLITGALTGIGRATAMAFAREGAQIVVSGRRDELGHALTVELRGHGAQAEYVHADVRREEDVRTLVEKTVERFGWLDVAVNNAGTEGQLGSMTEQSSADCAASFETNVLGTLLSIKHEMRVMLHQGRGSIVNLSSMAGRVGVAGASVFVASMHAVEGLTKSAALEGVAAGVRVNAVAPGPVETEMLERFTRGNADAKTGFLSTIPARRAATSEEVAQTIVFLASENARYLTGQSIAVDGGYVTFLLPTRHENTFVDQSCKNRGQLWALHPWLIDLHVPPHGDFRLSPPRFWKRRRQSIAPQANSFAGR